MTSSSRKEILNTYVDQKLRLRLRILMGVVVIMLILTAINIIKHPGLWWYSLVSIIVGYILGRIFFFRQNTIHFDETSLKVIGKMDWIGGILLAISISLDLGKEWLLLHWFPENLIGLIGYSFIAGMMFGRVAKNMKQIKEIIRLVL